MVQFEEDFNSQNEMWSGVGWGGYLRPDQFLDHLTVIIIVSLKIWLRAQMIYEKKTAAATSGRRKVFRRPGFLAAQILTLRCHPFKTTFSIFVQATFQVYYFSTLF